MDEAPHEPSKGEARSGPRQRWDATAAIIASLIGLLALVVSGYTAYIQRQQVRAEVWPWLVAGNDDLQRALLVYNRGVGPAIVGSVQIFVDGKPETDWHHVLAALGIPKPKDFYQATINPNVLTPESEFPIIRFPDETDWKTFRNAALDRMTMDICFCSTLGECWMYSDRHPIGYKQSTDLVKPIARCPVLPDSQTFKN